MTDVWKVGIQEHNWIRRKRGLQDLKGDHKMHSDAQEHAEFLASSNMFEPTIGIYGSNIFYSSKEKSSDAVREAVQALQRGNDGIRSYFNFCKADIHNLGIGVARNRRMGQWVVVMFYDLPGTKDGHYSLTPNLQINFNRRGAW